MYVKHGRALLILIGRFISTAAYIICVLCLNACYFFSFPSLFNFFFSQPTELNIHFCHNFSIHRNVSNFWFFYLLLAARLSSHVMCLSFLLLQPIRCLFMRKKAKKIKIQTAWHEINKSKLIRENEGKKVKSMDNCFETYMIIHTYTCVLGSLLLFMYLEENQMKKKNRGKYYHRYISFLTLCTVCRCVWRVCCACKHKACTICLFYGVC